MLSLSIWMKNHIVPKHNIVLIFGNIVFIDFKDNGRLHMPKINIARWRLLEILLLEVF
jgi:hypothetical protein